jgi:hypothetical protein
MPSDCGPLHFRRITAMKPRATVTLSGIALLVAACSGPRLDEKGFQVGPVENPTDTSAANGLDQDSLAFETRPSNVLLTGMQPIRLVTLYKVNRRKDDGSIFIGSNSFHYRYEEVDDGQLNNWNGHLMPGFEAAYGYNLVNVAHYDIDSGVQRLFFEKPVLIKTLYYPAFSRDTLNGAPVGRDFFIVTAYDEDTNKDGFINTKDLRRIHHFGADGLRKGALVPANASVMKSEYDPANDFMYVFARLDENANGRSDEQEPIHVHWIDLKDPARTGRLYGAAL